MVAVGIYPPLASEQQPSGRRDSHSSPAPAPHLYPLAEHQPYAASYSTLHVAQSNASLSTAGYNESYASIPPQHSGYSAHLHPGYVPQPQHHPVYGAVPQNPAQHDQQYGMSPPQPSQMYLNQSTATLGNSPPQPTQPYFNQSNATLGTSPPQAKKNGRLKTQWKRVDRLASKSCADLRSQLTSGAQKSVDLTKKSVDMTEKSVVMLSTHCIERPANLITKKSTQALTSGAALCDILCTKLDAVITSIDGEKFSGEEQDLMLYDDPTDPSGMNLVSPGGAKEAKGSNHFSKVWQYANSRLPPHLPPFKVYMPTYPLICLAAKYSERVYTPPPPKSSEKDTHIEADWRSGTKAMVLKCVPDDEMNAIVFAIRGSQTFMDWAVNYRSAPTSPEGFLDDPGNLCHAGFLYVARKMVKPVADRLRTLLQENPSRSHCSLLITGHSAGGAVAALLYAHMMSDFVQSELSYLTGFFKRVHCITFGAPPVSLLPLQKPEDRRHRKSLFYAFVNEGDPVPRADKSVVRSLLKLYAAPAPNNAYVTTLKNISKLELSCPSSNTLESTTTNSSNSSSNSPPLQPLSTSPPSTSKPKKSSKKSSKPSKSTLRTTTTNTSTNTNTSTLSSAPTWSIPPSSLSPFGRLIILRRRPHHSSTHSNSRGGHFLGGGHSHGHGHGHGKREEEEDVEAVTVDDELFREVVYGDPMKHQMSLYRKRVESIATRAVTAGGW